MLQVSKGPLRLHELQLDAELKRRIAEWHIRSTLEAQAKADAEEDVYSF